MTPIRRFRSAGLMALAMMVAMLAAAPARAEIDPKADAVLKKMSDLLKSSKQFTFSAVTTRDIPTSEGILLQFSHNLDVAVRRPNGLRARVKGDVAERTLWYDGATITLLDSTNARYAATEAPGNVDDALDHLTKTYNADLPLADFVYSDPYAVLTENLRAGFYVGRHMVGGVATHHLAFVLHGVHWQLWVEDGENPWPRKFSIAYVDTPGVPRFTAEMSDWNLSPQLPMSRFKAEIPGNAMKVEFTRREE